MVVRKQSRDFAPGQLPLGPPKRVDSHPANGEEREKEVRTQPYADPGLFCAGKLWLWANALVARPQSLREKQTQNVSHSQKTASS